MPTDGATTSVADSVTVQVGTWIEGTAGADTIGGTAGDDKIRTFAGDDTIMVVAAEGVTGAALAGELRDLAGLE